MAKRLQDFLVEGCLIKDDESAERYIRAGCVLVNGEYEQNPDTLIKHDDIIKIEVKAHFPKPELTQTELSTILYLLNKHIISGCCDNMDSYCNLRDKVRELRGRL